MIDHDFAQIAATLNGEIRDFNAAADRARLTWQYESMVLRGFNILRDPSGDGETISPARCAHATFLPPCHPATLSPCRPAALCLCLCQ